MILSQDFREFIQSLNNNNARFLVVGGYAVAFHGHPRFTKDIDIWIWIDKQNAENVVMALDQFRFASLGLAPEDFLEWNIIIQLGYPPNRIDLIMGLTGVDFQEMLVKSRAKNWQVYAKPSFGDAVQTLDYLGRYVNRIAISNHRILDIVDGQVTYSYHDYNDGKQKKMVLPAVEFIRRFLQHVLPKRFVRVRYYGFLSPRYRAKKLAQCRASLGAYHESIITPASRAEFLMEMLGHDPEQCPMCGAGKMRPFEELKAHPTRRKWQLAVH